MTNNNISFEEILEEVMLGTVFPMNGVWHRKSVSQAARTTWDERSGCHIRYTGYDILTKEGWQPEKVRLDDFWVS